MKWADLDPGVVPGRFYRPDVDERLVPTRVLLVLAVVRGEELALSCRVCVVRTAARREGGGF